MPNQKQLLKIVNIDFSSILGGILSRLLNAQQGARQE